ncbi:type II secretion system F family protein [Sphingobium sp. DEHP117]|uniref:type II secretion system F family protein n=1 Tax=Sphingobium sp. DEHP117 TaxID=2993436 RepID=UPI0027D52B38|nr:type II secretion system F family protein [Sphingobium sp. DEHP117]MDQ4421085.1 type II secretion system F family protein [Sphingobium sp. DEHP117]
MDPKLILLLMMVGGALMLLALAFSGPSVSKAQSRRLSAVLVRHSAAAENQVEARMRKAIASASTQKTNAFTSLIPDPEKLAKRLRMTGKKWTLNGYMMTCAALTAGVAGLGLTRGWSPLTALFVGTAVGLGLPHKYVSMVIARRIKKFTQNFPDALELMVRGLRSGLPIAETLTIVSTEVPAPVGEEFKLVTERIKIGKTMDQALIETAERLGTPEFQFFCITLNIQRETGGNLAETLSNLATVLRQRAQMKLKINAMSSESKASAMIIGSLPFIVFGLISAINYSYMSPFFTPDPNGMFGFSLMQMIGIGGMCWMGIGVFIMAQMINFEI